MKLKCTRIDQLNQGQAETKNLMEALAVDFSLLISHVLPDFIVPKIPVGITKKMQVMAEAIYAQYKFGNFAQLKSHSSDTIRGLSCYVLSMHNFSLQQKLEYIKPLAADGHFGVREWAWLALRSEVASNLPEALALLESWTANSCANIRRFASEVTRPRGVWCSHIKALRQEPWCALALLEALKNDPAKYVQLSVANWLNDAGKDHPTWVIELCERWQRESYSAHTQKICKRALRRLITNQTIPYDLKKESRA